MSATESTDASSDADLSKRFDVKVVDPTPEEEYVARNGLVCPACGAESAYSTGHVQFDVPGALFEDNHCESCGATWTAQYRLVGYGELEA